jgi:hypothetical protein
VKLFSCYVISEEVVCIMTVEEILRLMASEGLNGWAVLGLFLWFVYRLVYQYGDRKTLTAVLDTLDKHVKGEGQMSAEEFQQMLTAVVELVKVLGHPRRTPFQLNKKPDGGDSKGE